MTNEFILPWKPHIVAITRTDSKCYQKAILQLYHLFPWQRNLIKPNKRWHAFFFTYQSLSNCKVWINIWLSVATEFLFLHINDLNCLLLFFFNSDEYVLYHWKKRRYQSSYGNSYSISTIFRDKIILIVFSKAIDLDVSKPFWIYIQMKLTCIYIYLSALITSFALSYIKVLAQIANILYNCGKT